MTIIGNKLKRTIFANSEFELLYIITQQNNETCVSEDFEL